MTASPLAFYAMLALVILLIGLSKGGLGGALGMMATPLMALVMPADQVLGLVLPLLIIADVFAVTWLWRMWDARALRLLLPSGVAGVMIGTFVITNAPTGLLQTILGVIVLVFALYKLFEGRIMRGMHYRPRPWHGVLAGITSGLASSLAHTGSPPISVYLLLLEVPPLIFAGTSAIFFAAVNWVKVPFYFYAGLFDWALFLQALWLTPLLPLSVWLGKWGAARMDPRRYERVITWLLVLTGLLLIVQPGA